MTTSPRDLIANIRHHHTPRPAELDQTAGPTGQVCSHRNLGYPSPYPCLLVKLADALEAALDRHPSPTAGGNGSNVVELHRPPSADPIDIDRIALQLRNLVDLGRDIAARSSTILVPDAELVLAGQRVEHIATRVFEAVFGVPVGTEVGK